MPSGHFEWFNFFFFFGSLLRLLSGQKETGISMHIKTLFKKKIIMMVQIDKSILK
jgi:hypothetical protein